MNDLVLIKLTPIGLHILRADHESLRTRAPYLGEFKPPEVDADGYTKMQLWEVMRTFGPHCYNGCRVPFDTEIKLCS